jgi:phosphoglycolate phosphatase
MPELIPLLKNCESLLFDFDGTLAPNLDLPDMRKQVIKVTENYDIPNHIYEDLYIVEIIEASHRFLRLQKSNLADEYSALAHNLITNIELAEAKKTSPFKGIENMLTVLRGRSIKLGVVTRNCREAVLTVFPELMRFVDCLVARDDTPFLKPDVRHLTRALSLLNSDPTLSAVVGDGELDMQVGRQLGITTIGVLSGNTSSEKLSLAGADFILEDCKRIFR